MSPIGAGGGLFNSAFVPLLHFMNLLPPSRQFRLEAHIRERVLYCCCIRQNTIKRKRKQMEYASSVLLGWGTLCYAAVRVESGGVIP